MTSGADLGRSLLGAPARFPAGLAEVGDGVLAWLQPNGELGESNAGLVRGDGASLLVDTLWDLPLTARMLAAMSAHTAGAPITTVVNTHADGDHCWGNQLVAGAELIGAAATVRDLGTDRPALLRALVAAAPALRPLTRSRARRGPLAAAAAFAELAGQLSAYHWGGIRVTAPRRSFTGRLTLDVGGRRVEVLELGPAHTPGDSIVHVPDAGVVFTGDLVFAGVAPIMWVGPVDTWVAALDTILDLEPRVVVPGHGPLTDADGVRELRAYWRYVAERVRHHVAAGTDPVTAARRILSAEAFGAQPFAGWDGHERLVVSAHALARADRGGTGRVAPARRAALILEMVKLGRERAAGQTVAAPTV